MLFILLPAYNEEEGIEKLLERFIRITRTFAPDYKILIVNDGSRDHTAQVVECFKNQLNIEIISFPQNRGVTEVFRAGFKRVCEEGKDDDICVTMDSDNTQNPFVLLDIVEKIRAGFDIVIASRYAEGGKVVGAPFVRNILSNSVAWIMGQVAHIPGVRDYSTFYRGIRVGLIKKGFAKYKEELISGHGFSGMAGLLVKLSTLTEKITEVPFTLRYDLKEGGSGMRIFKTIFGYLVLISDILRQNKLREK
jgi:dolichol-phosphate mannosyltransferase